MFIYYAGHGQYDQARDHGWWVPTDGEPRQAGTLITNATILRYIKGMQARHVYLVADSCFSGSLFGTRALPPITDRWYAELYKDRSRWGLTSGATEPVADKGLEGHSPFAYFLLKVLRENTQPYLVPSTIHESLAPLVANNTTQVPRSEPLTQTGDEGGQFVFRLTETPAKPPAPPVVDFTPYQQLQKQTEYQAELEKAWSIVQKFVKNPRFTTDQWIKALNQFERDFPTANPHRDEIRRLQQQIKTGEPSVAKHHAGQDFRDCPVVCPEMVVIPTGRFQMGNVSGKGYRKERPVHHVTIEYLFAVGKYEVTFAEWDACVAAGGCRHRPDDEGWGRGTRPVINVSWKDAQEYVQWLSRETGKPYRLLSEAEWEYVARAGSRTKYWWGDNLGTNNANCEVCGSQWDNTSTAPVGSFAANAFGVFDTAGNVWEWVADCWHDDYEGAPADGSAWTSRNCDQRVARGGSWNYWPEMVRPAFRSKYYSSYRHKHEGFRITRTLTP